MRTSTRCIIGAVGFWNGAQRKLYWSQALPWLAWWEGTDARALVFEGPSDAEEDLIEARRALRNDRITVVLEPAAPQKGPVPQNPNAFLKTPDNIR